MEFLSLVVAAFLLPVFDVKALSAATCYESTGVWVGWVHLSPWSMGRCILKGVGQATWIAVNVLFPHSSYENLDALDGGDDGMRVIKTILALAPSLLKDSG